MKRKLLLILCCLNILISYKMLSQSLFSKVYYKESFPVQAFTLLETADKDLLMSGSCSYSPFILKTDSFGSIKFSKKIDKGGMFSGHVSCNDSEFVFSGSIYNTIDSSMNAFLTKVNKNGDTLWTKEYNFEKNDYSLCLIKTNDNGFAISGTTSKDQNFDNIQLYQHSNVFVAKLDNNGNLIWGKEIICSNFSSKALSVTQTPDSSYILTGFLIDSLSYNNISKKMIIIKLNKNGDLIWTKKHDWDNYYTSFGLDIKSIDNSIFVYFSSSNGIGVLNLSLAGNENWCNIYDSNPIWEYDLNVFPKMQINSKKEIYLHSGSKFVKIDSLQNILWARVYELNTIIEITETKERSLLVLGDGPIWGVKYQMEKEIGIIKVDSLGNTMECGYGIGSSISTNFPITFSIVPTSTINVGIVKSNFIQISDVIVDERFGCVDFLGKVKENSLESLDFTVTPNPSNGIFNIKIDNGNSKLFKINIYNSIGENIFSKNTKETILDIDLRKYKCGLFYVIIDNDECLITKKILIIN